MKRLALFPLVALVLAACQDATEPTEIETTPVPQFHFAPGGVVLTLSGFGTPTIDGIFSPGEWDGAGQVSVFSGALLGSVFFAMNDENNLYLALSVVDPTLSFNDGMEVRFDNTHNGVFDDDDELVATAFQFRDNHCSGGAVPSCGIRDSQQDGSSAAASTGTANFFEVSHPLNSGDPDDFSLSVGDIVGFCLRYFLEGVATSPGTDFPTACFFSLNQFVYPDILIAAPPVTPFAAFDIEAAEVELGPGTNDDEFEVEGSFTLGPSSDGMDPLTEDVTLEVGTFSITIPAGSFELENSGSLGEFEFEGDIGGMTLEFEIEILEDNSFEFEVEGEGADLTGTVNPVEVTLTIGDDTGTTSVTAEIEEE